MMQKKKSEERINQKKDAMQKKKKNKAGYTEGRSSAGVTGASGQEPYAQKAQKR